MSKQNFISYARNHPELANYVLNGKVTWQQLYEIYEIYGENNNILENYTKNNIDLNSFKEDSIISQYNSIAFIESSFPGIK